MIRLKHIKPNTREIEISEKLKKIIIKEINLFGKITFHKFMDFVLYHQEFGYYMRETKDSYTKDFVTAPMISPLFSQGFAYQFEKILKNMNGGTITEFGAGMGHFAVECLKYLESHQAPINKYYIIEISPNLQNIQKKYLKHNLPRRIYKMVQWTHYIPNNSKGIVVANEFLDALPVEIFKYQHKNFYQMNIKEHQGKLFSDFSKEMSISLRKNIESLDLPFLGLDNTYISEINLNYNSWLRTLKNSLQSGVIFICDYGYSNEMYYRKDRDRGSLRCYYKQRVSDNPLKFVGLQDITAHVNFTTIAKLSLEMGLELEGYFSQSDFLIQSNILSNFKSITANITNSEVRKETNNLKKLIMDPSFGEMYQVMVLSHNYKNEITSLKNSKHHLL